MSIQQSLFGFAADGKEVTKFTIKNKGGSFIELLTYGATWLSCFVPDRDGVYQDVLLGFDDMDGWASISEEQVLQRDPDYIVTITMYFGEGPTPEEEIRSRDGWDGLSAVRNGGIFNADGDAITRPGPRLLDAAYALYEFVNRPAEEVPAA